MRTKQLQKVQRKEKKRPKITRKTNNSHANRSTICDALCMLYVCYCHKAYVLSISRFFYALRFVCMLFAFCYVLCVVYLETIYVRCFYFFEILLAWEMYRNGQLLLELIEYSQSKLQGSIFLLKWPKEGGSITGSLNQILVLDNFHRIFQFFTGLNGKSLLKLLIFKNIRKENSKKNFEKKNSKRKFEKKIRKEFSKNKNSKENSRRKFHFIQKLMKT